jgi:hypothetical protein
MIKPEILEQELNKLYKTNPEEYKKDCDFWKAKGYKIFRNSKGEHRVKIDTRNATSAAMKDLFGNNLTDVLGDMFGFK